jgi:hypothetical protein
MQPMWLWIVSSRQFEGTFYNAQWRKVKKCNQCDCASSQAGGLRTHLKTHSGEKTNKCNQWDFASFYISALRKHLKIHSGEKPNKCNQCDFALSQAGHFRAHLKTHSLLKCNSFIFRPREFSHPFLVKSYHLLPKVAKNWQILPIVAVKRYYFLLVIICFKRANDQGKISRGQNVLAQNFTQDKMLQDRMSPNHSISLKD